MCDMSVPAKTCEFSDAQRMSYGQARPPMREPVDFRGRTAVWGPGYRLLETSRRDDWALKCAVLTRHGPRIAIEALGKPRVRWGESNQLDQVEKACFSQTSNDQQKNIECEKEPKIPAAKQIWQALSSMCGSREAPG